jgi:hypothetical protein
MATPQLTEVAGIGEVAAANLTAAGIRTVGQLAAAGLERIQAVPGFGPAKAESAKSAARALLDTGSAAPAAKKRPTKKRPTKRRATAPATPDDDQPATAIADDGKKSKQTKKPKSKKSKKSKKDKAKKHKGKKGKKAKKAKKAKGKKRK